MRSQLTLGSSKFTEKALLQFPELFKVCRLCRQDLFMKKANRWLSESKVSLQNAPVLKVANTRKEFGTRGRKETLLSTRILSGIRKRTYGKDTSGRGTRRQQWVKELYDDFLEDFAHARKAGIKVNHAVIRSMVLSLVRDAPERSSFHHLEKDLVSGKPITIHISIPFVKRFCQEKGIVQRSKAGKLMCSTQKREKLSALLL